MNIKDLFKKFSANGLARDSAIVFMGSMVANIGAYVYHLLMGRMLGPVGYGELSSLLSLLYIFTVPLLVGQMALVKFVSGFKAKGEIGQAKALFKSVIKKSLIASLIGLPIAYILSPYISAYLHLSSNVLFVMVYILFIISLVTIISASMLQGYQMFLWLSILGAAGILFKVIISIPFVTLGIIGVLLAALLAAILTFVFYFIPLKFFMYTKPKPLKLTKRDALKFTFPTLLTLLGITSIYSTDIILVRHFFPAKEAGVYAALAVLGKMIFYASSSVATVLFPVISERSAKGVKSQKLVITAILAVTFASTVLTVGYFLFPEFIITMLFGNSYGSVGSLLGLFGIFIALFSIANIVINSCLGLGKTGIWIVPVTSALIQILVISVFHSTILDVIIINICIALLLVVGSLGYYMVKIYEKI